MKVRGQWSRVSHPWHRNTDHGPGTTAVFAFTLIELMVVVGIMAIIVAIGIPFMANVVNGGKGISRAGRDVQQVCSDTRALAILRQSPMDLRIRPADGVFEFSGAGGTDSRTPEGLSSTGGSRGGSSVTLPEGVVIEALGINGDDWTEDEVANVRFYPDGTSDEMRIVLYRPSTGERRYMHLEVVTGLAVLAETEVSKFMKVR